MPTHPVTIKLVILGTLWDLFSLHFFHLQLVESEDLKSLDTEG